MLLLVDLPVACSHTQILRNLRHEARAPNGQRRRPDLLTGRALDEGISNPLLVRLGQGRRTQAQKMGQSLEIHYSVALRRSLNLAVAAPAPVTRVLYDAIPAHVQVDIGQASGQVPA